jgi:energy-coupling factor transport system substrate-specific component
MKTRELTGMALLGTVLFVGQVALAFLPNIEVVSVLVLVYTLNFGRKALFPIYVFVILEGIIYGFGLWWVMYLYVWLVLYITARLLRRNTSSVIWAVVNAFYGLSFGALCTIPYLILGGPGMAVASWTSGLLFDIFHGIGNFVVTLILYHPLMRVLRCVRRQEIFAENGNNKTEI